jgi:hypothetical protein
MGLYYFHVLSEDECISDWQGTELKDLSACHEHALRIIGACRPFIQSDPRRWWIDVEDSEGEKRLMVVFPNRAMCGLHHYLGDIGLGDGC